MKTILKLEDCGVLLLSVFLFSQLSFAWWWFLVLFLTPDVGFVGYAFNTKIGAFCYNILHHKGVAVVFYILGTLMAIEFFQLVGVIMLGHAAFDRLLGYGLKYNDSFHHTHLGYIGKPSKRQSKHKR